MDHKIIHINNVHFLISIYHVQILNDEADFILANWDPDRCQVLDCLQYITETRHGFLVPVPNTKPFYRAFASPFSPAVWLVMLISTIIMSIVLTTNKQKISPTYNWLRLVGTWVGQDLERDLVNRPIAKYNGIMAPVLKFVPLGTWYLMIGLMTIIYSASVLQFFTNPFEKKISTLSQLLHTDWYIGISPNDDILINYVNNTVAMKPILALLRQRMQENPLDSYLNFYPGPGQAFIQDEVTLGLKALNVKQTDYERWQKSYLVIDARTMPRFYKTLLFKKSFPITSKLRNLLQKFIEAGLYDHYKNKWLGDLMEKLGLESRRDDSPTSDNQDGHGSTVIKLEHLGGVFYIFAAGMCFSVLVLMAECIFYHVLQTCKRGS